MLKLLLSKFLLFGFFIIPLISNFLSLGTEQAKVIAFIFYTTLAAFIWEFSKSKKLKWTKIKFLTGLFVLSLTTSSVFGLNPYYSFLGKEPYFQGVFVFVYLFFFSIIVSSVKISLRSWAKVITFSSFFVSLIALDQFILIHLFNANIQTYAGRVTSTFGQPNFYSGFLLLSLPFYFYLFSNSKKYFKFYLFSFLVTSIAIFLSNSRTAIFLFLATILFQLIIIVPKTTRFLLIILSSLLIITSIYFSANKLSGIIYKEIIEPRSNQWILENSPEKRVLIWPVFLEIISQKPIFGYGLENIDSSFTNYMSSIKVENAALDPSIFSLKNVYINRSHNFFLDLLVTSGILGLLAFIILIIALLVKSGKNLVPFSSLILFLIWIQVQNLSIVHLMYFFLITGLIDKLPD